MERKTITTKKETSIIKKQESKTEVCDSGHIRRTKSEILTEYVIIETQLILDNVNPNRPSAENESFPEQVKKKVTEKEDFSMPDIPEENFSRTADHFNVSEINESSLNEEGPTDVVSHGVGEALDSLKCNEYDVLTRQENRIEGHLIINKENSPHTDHSSNLNGTVSYTAAQSTPFKQCENKSLNINSESISKEPNNITLGDENTGKYINRKVSNLPCLENGLNEAEMSKMNSLINNLAMHLSQRNDEDVKCMAETEDDVIMVKMGKKLANKESLKDNDIYNKGDSYLIPSACTKRRKEDKVILDRESLERSVSYLVDFFENIKSCSSNKTKKVEGILESKEIKSGKPAGDINAKRDKCLILDSLESFRTRRDSNEKKLDYRSENNDLKGYKQRKEVKTSDIAKTGDVMSSTSKVSNEFCFLKYKRPQSLAENLKSDIKQTEKNRFMPSCDVIKDGSNNITAATEHSFISPRFACKKIRPYFCRPLLSHVELQMPNESDNTAYSSELMTNGNQMVKRNTKKDSPKEADSKSFIFLTPKDDNVTRKKTTNSKNDEHRSRMKKRIVSVSKEPEDNCGYYGTVWTFSDKMCVSFAVIFTIILAFYKYSFTA